ncbi:hypothetical protein ABW19_dt0200138 [Dactylella cylindrospora]|nr:hypothetical protein ABW19_dt0200138 [Dactylella cylindrospora]
MTGAASDIETSSFPGSSSSILAFFASTSPSLTEGDRERFLLLFRSASMALAASGGCSGVGALVTGSRTFSGSFGVSRFGVGVGSALSTVGAAGAGSDSSCFSSSFGGSTGVGSSTAGSGSDVFISSSSAAISTSWVSCTISAGFSGSRVDIEVSASSFSSPFGSSVFSFSTSAGAGLA